MKYEKKKAVYEFVKYEYENLYGQKCNYLSG